MKKWFYYFILIIFCLSGFSALIYQSIWSKYLGLFLGHAAYAQTLVLIIFMGGLAIGSWLAGHYSHRFKQPIKLYAIAEGIIGILGILFHWLFINTTSLTFDTIIPAVESTTLIHTIKWSLAALLILPQSILLGVTFPLMSASLIRLQTEQHGKIISILYFTNSIGAAIGALFGVFFLLPNYGLPGAMMAAGIINLIITAIVWLIAPKSNQPAIQPANKETKATISPFIKAVLIASGLTGLASFMYEIAWIRMLSLALGSTIHAFELMLSAFITGLAFGGLWIRKHIDRISDPIKIAGYIQVAMGLTALLTLPLYGNAFEWVSFFINSLAKTEGGYTLYNIASSVISMAIMLPSTFCAGMTLPLFTYALLKKEHGEQSIGKVYAANTLGAIIGVLLAVHIGLPMLGLKLMMILAAMIDIGLGIVLLRLFVVKLNYPRYLTALATGIIGIALTLLLVQLDPLKMASGVFRHGIASQAKGSQTLFYQDGKTASISVIYTKTGKISIATNGKPDAAIMIKENAKPSPDEYTMMLLGAIPMSINPNIEYAANIGFGSGLTTHTILGNPNVKQLDTIEIEPAMVEGAKIFGERVKRAYSDPRSHIIIDDAKTYFAANKTKYDLIVSEPSNPWVSGVSNLFTEEFYGFISNQLNENGLFVQWLHLYEIDLPTIATIFKALSAHMQDFLIFESNVGDIILIGSPNNKIPTLTKDIFKFKKLVDELQRIGITSIVDIETRYLGNKALLFPYFNSLESIQANSDFFPILSLNTPVTRFIQKTAAEIHTLNTVGFPFLELLNTNDITYFYHNSSFTSSSKRGKKIANANKILHVLTTDSLNSTPQNKLDTQVPFIESMNICPQPTQEQGWLNQIHNIAISTIPYLSPEQANTIWKQERWQHCQSLATETKKQLSLYTALANRNKKSTVDLATSLLENEQKDTGHPISDFLVDVALLNAIVTNQIERANTINKNYGHRQSTIKYKQFIRELLIAQLKTHKMD